MAGAADDGALGHSRSGGGRGNGGGEAGAFAETMRMLTNRISVFVSLPMMSLDTPAYRSAWTISAGRRRPQPP